MIARNILRLSVGAVVVAGALGVVPDQVGRQIAWQVFPTARAQSVVQSLLARLRGKTLPDGIAKANGRIEATQVDVSTKYAGRLIDVAVNEGDSVTVGQIIGRVSSPEYEAELKRAQAQTLKAKQSLAEAEALIAQRTSDVDFTKADNERAQQLLSRGVMSKQDADRRRNAYQSAEANYRAAVAQRDQAQHAIQTAEADVERVQAILTDLTLVAPRSGRVQFLLARSGEVVSPGARILTILDLKDVYLTIFLPAADAGRLGVGDEARIILDPVPQYVVPATVSFVASDAQFTPKSVETQEERSKLMFRVKLQLSPDVLEQYYSRVKTGVRGLGFVRTRTDVSWPGDLVVNLPK